MAEPDRSADVLGVALRHGLRLSGDRLTIVETGLDFRVALAQDQDGVDWVLRLPRRPGVMQHTAREQRLLRLIATRVPFAVPDWKIRSDELIAYPCLPGQQAVTLDPQTLKPRWHFERDSARYRQSFAAALAALHGVDAEAVTRIGFKPMTEDRLRRSTFEDMLRVQQELGVADALWRRWQAWLDDDDAWPTQAVLVHGDLHVGHVFVDEAACVRGIIDWSEARLADPAFDFMLHLLGFGAASLDALIADYAAAGGRVWPQMARHVAERLAAYPVQYALFALDSGDATHLAAVRERLR
ncbi:macrolide 2'-phosphotransferase [Chiayiivirga flava]|uniref:Macrolide phosphotransferase n=1 Tax=Chiayiivirga flava TaxID=659595 RepID=A0A7W8D3J9_9GAMM|nr:macrolide 2'-phosphotransferase [Chiayiivirga flava]MBB5207296.1 macrolide phosphotransferase [Chiayiivirga flava]